MYCISADRQRYPYIDKEQRLDDWHARLILHELYSITMHVMYMYSIPRIVVPTLEHQVCWLCFQFQTCFGSRIRFIVLSFSLPKY